MFKDLGVHSSTIANLLTGKCYLYSNMWFRTRYGTRIVDYATPHNKRRTVTRMRYGCTSNFLTHNELYTSAKNGI